LNRTIVLLKLFAFSLPLFAQVRDIDPMEVHLENVRVQTARINMMKEHLAEKNRMGVTSLKEHAHTNREPDVLLWSHALEKRMETFPFANLHLPDSVTGMPPPLVQWSTRIREETKGRIQEAKKKQQLILGAATRDMEQHVQNLVRKNEIETAQKDRTRFAMFDESNEVKRLENAIRNLERILSPKHHRHDWRNTRRKTETEQSTPADARFLFEQNNPGFLLFQKSVRAQSSGFHGKKSSGIHIPDRPLITGKRGLTLAAKPLGREWDILHFDTYAQKSESLRLVRYIRELPYGSFIILIAHDDATRRFSEEAQSTLYRVGAEKGIKPLPYRSSYLLLGIKGLRPGNAHEQFNDSYVQFPATQNRQE